MKSKILTLLVISFLSVVVVNGQNTAKKNNPVGTWKFEAPYAPARYTSGIIEVVFAEKKYSASMMFSGSEYKIAGEKVKFKNDSLYFSVYIEDQDVVINLNMEEGTKMSGKAIYSEGEVPLTLTKNVTLVEEGKK
ncbi:MAG: hypothetical protein NT144_09640 [Bacteroidia bacterium]|nr:hypothetical protein [Bacteroidia bacterium]